MSNHREKTEISIIIPAFDCAETIHNSLLSIYKILSTQEYNFELIVVIDGKDEKIANEISKLNYKYIKILHYEKNRGKGFAVKLGIESAEGDYIGYIDAGGDINPKSLVTAINEIKKGGVSIICGSKKHKLSKVYNYTLIRRIFTTGYNLFVRILLGINYSDTQVGLKLYTRELVNEVFPKMLVKRFAFEVEMLAVANLSSYKNHKDIPVEITFSGKSTAATLKSIVYMVWDTFAVFYRMRIKRYYQHVDEVSISARRDRELLNIRFL